MTRTLKKSIGFAEDVVVSGNGGDTLSQCIGRVKEHMNMAADASFSVYLHAGLVDVLAEKDCSSVVSSLCAQLEEFVRFCDCRNSTVTFCSIPVVFDTRNNVDHGRMVESCNKAIKRVLHRLHQKFLHLEIPSSGYSADGIHYNGYGGVAVATQIASEVRNYLHGTTLTNAVTMQSRSTYKSSKTNRFREKSSGRPRGRPPPAYPGTLNGRRNYSPQNFHSDVSIPVWEHPPDFLLNGQLIHTHRA